MKKKARALILAISLCAPVLFAGWTSSSARINSRAKIALLRLQARGVEAEYLDAEMEVPGFAGVYIDSVTHKPVVMLTDQRRRRRAKIEMARILNRRKHGAESLAFREATFPFSDLFQWKMDISRALSGEGVLRYIGIDKRHNVVVVGVLRRKDKQALKATLSRLGIPHEAVEFQQSNGIGTVSDLMNTAFSPQVTGEQIVWSKYENG